MCEALGAADTYKYSPLKLRRVAPARLTAEPEARVERVDHLRRAARALAAAGEEEADGADAPVRAVLQARATPSPTP